MNNLFIAFTPYHVLLAYSIAIKRKPENNFLFIVSEFPNADILAHAIKQSKKAVFSDVIVLPGVHRGRNAFVKIFIRRRNIGPLKEFIGEREISNVFVGNDSRVEAQVALHFAKENNKQSRGIYIEDGTEAYRSEVNSRNTFRLLSGKIFFGRWWKDINILGTSPWIDQVAAIFPDFVRPEIASKEIIPIEKESFLLIKDDDSFTRYLDALGLNLKKLQGIDVLLISTNSEMKNRYPEYQAVAKDTIKLIERHKLKLAVKYHPRELSGDFLSVGKKEGILLLPEGFPAELLYVLSQKPPKLIIGDFSSALLTARWLLDKSRIVSIAPLSKYYDYNIFEIFKKINIQLVSVKEVEEILRKI